MKTKPQKPAQLKFSYGSRMLLFLLLWLGIIYLFQGSFRGPQIDELSYTQFKEQVKSGAVAEVVFTGQKIQGLYKEEEKDRQQEAGQENQRSQPQPTRFVTAMPAIQDAKLIDLLEENGVAIRADPEERSWLMTLFVTLLPWVLIIGFFVYSSRKMQQRMGGGGGGIFGFGKSKAKLFQRSESDVTFEDVAGLSNAKKELEEIVGFLKDPTAYLEIGAELPKGVLLVGPPGTGKTLLSRAVAGEANVPFYNISGSDFIEMFVGVGASRVRDMFSKAKKEAPSIIFIDEIDSIGRVRGTGVGGGHDEREQTLNQILNEMDGFAPNESVVVMAATNRPDVLDNALIRPGRFDRRVMLNLPQKKAREQILKVHTREVKIGDDVDLAVIGNRTVGFSGAELKNLVNEAALLAARKGKEIVEAEDFDQSRDKILMGLEREDIIKDEDKEVIAYHESGHALMAKLLPGSDTLKKVTIIPRGRALGATEQIPEENQYNLKKSYLLDRAAILLGGRAAEKIKFEDVTTGAGDDLKKTTQLVRRMVCQWGMSDVLGPVFFRHGEQHPFLGREMAAEPRDFSENTAQIIDEEVRRIITEAQERAQKTLTEHRNLLDRVAEALLENETLTNEDIDKLLEENDEGDV